MEEQGIVNRVARSGLIQLDMGDFFPSDPVEEYDIAQNLWKGIALKEKEFRVFIKENDWSSFTGKHVAIHCSVDAIIPSWAYMLLASALKQFSLTTHFGNKEEAQQAILLDNINRIQPDEYQDARVVIKGCGDKEISAAAWVAITNKLKPTVKMLMFGEPCSTVPIYKKPR